MHIRLVYLSYVNLGNGNIIVLLVLKHLMQGVVIVHADSILPHLGNKEFRFSATAGISLSSIFIS